MDVSSNHIVREGVIEKKEPERMPGRPQSMLYHRLISAVDDKPCCSIGSLDPKLLLVRRHQEDAIGVRMWPRQAVSTVHFRAAG